MWPTTQFNELPPGSGPRSESASLTPSRLVASAMCAPRKITVKRAVSMFFSSLLEHVSTQIGEHFRHLAQEVFPVGPLKGVHARMIPAIGRAVLDHPARERFHFGLEVGIEKERKGQPVVIGAVPHA